MASLVLGEVVILLRPNMLIALNGLFLPLKEPFFHNVETNDALVPTASVSWAVMDV